MEIPGINVDAAGKVAILYGNISDAGDPQYSEKGFVYSLTDTYPTIYDTKIVVSGDNHGQFEAKLSQLEYDTEYYVRAYASNEAGTAYSDMLKILIETSLPTVLTHYESDMDVEHNIVVLHGEITDIGVPAYKERGFVYSDIYESPTIYDSKFVVSGTGKGLFEFRCTELPLDDKRYYVRSYASNAKGVAYGNVIILAEKNWVELPEINIAVMNKNIGSGKWCDMNDLCENCTHEGYLDWRLPTKDELATIYNNRSTINNLTGDQYWSSTIYSGSLYYYLDFSSGGTWHYASSNSAYTSERCYARCVRTLN